jgi:hypothetical protein
MIEVTYEEEDGSGVTIRMTDKGETFFYDPCLKCTSCGKKNEGDIVGFEDYKSPLLSVSGLTYCGYCKTIFGANIIRS